jgi:uroporphyrin-III C-methyltransferase / precorrin-2 dehydrogenase / sirohydrochlorin ferrochelatase
MTNLFPAFLKLEARRVVVVGGGRVAASKLDALLDAGADVTVVAPAIIPEIKKRRVTTIERAFVDGDLDGAWWVVAAAPPEVNRAVGVAAASRRVFVNAVDDPRHATAYLGGVVRRDDVTVAISTNGRAPALAGLMREALEAWLPADLARWLATSDDARRHWKSDGTPMEQRRRLLLDLLNNIYRTRETPQEIECP